MAYIKQNWQNGDVITAEKLNHIEDGIMESGGGSTLIINVIEGGAMWTLDKTWQEIYDAHSSGVVCIIKYTTEESGYNRQLSFNISLVESEVYTNHAAFNVVTYNHTFSATSPNGYPSVSLD